MEKERQIVFNTVRCNVAAHVLINAALTNIYLKQVVPLLPKPSNGCVVEGKFFCRQQVQTLYAFDSPLRIGIKGSQGIDFIIKQIDAYRQGGTHGIDVHQGTTHGILTALGNGFDALISGGLQG